jgi:4-amino-4-deoxy-L-arabinose transferase-like glycosyltransferase
MDPGRSLRLRTGAMLMIAGAAIVRLAYLTSDCPLDLAPDEAHYWDWSRELDWSYYSKGPLVAWLIRASCELFGPLSQILVESDMLAVRLPAVMCGSLMLVGLYVLTFDIHQSDKLAFAVVAAALTLPIVVAGATLMTIDAPFTCAWMWALVFGHRALFRQASWAWPMTGLCILVGILAKHTMVLWVPSLMLFLVTTPGFRAHLGKPGFWVMVALGALGGVPILAWNALNGWVTLLHTRTHVGIADEVNIRLWGPLAYVGGQFGVLLGFWFIVWARAMWHHRPTIETTPELRYLWWMSAPSFAFFGLFTFTNGGGGANWPIAAYLSGMVLAANWLAGELRAASTWYRRLTQGGAIAAIGLGLLLTLVLHEPIQMQPVLLSIAGPATKERPMPIRRVDPTSRLRGWRRLAAEVDRVRGALQARGLEPVLATERWTQAAELGFYCHGHPRIHCLGVMLGDRDSQYDMWRPNPTADEADFRGRTFLLVGMEMDRLEYAFAGYESTRLVPYYENGQLIAEWTIVVAHGFRGFGMKKGIKSD